MKVAERPAPAWTFIGVAVLNFIATVQVVWFYISCVPSYLHLGQFEAGLEKTPFQHRMLMMYPLRWAHHSTWLNAFAKRLTNMPGWFPRGVRPEGLMEAPIDLLCVMAAGLVARSLYKASSRQLLTPFVYPLVLVMVTATYSLYTMHWLRFVYDLPSLGLFSVGLYLIYFRRSVLLFGALFAFATINRETTLFLLILYLLAECVDTSGKTQAHVNWSRLRALRTWGVAAVLAAIWIGWHVWVKRHFAGNVSVERSRVWLNVGILMWPLSWAQVLSTFAFCAPVVLVCRKLVRDMTLRLWVVILPVWFVFMLRYGVLLETRIFGELIPYMACMMALVAEEQIVLKARRTFE